MRIERVKHVIHLAMHSECSTKSGSEPDQESWHEKGSVMDGGGGWPAGGMAQGWVLRTICSAGRAVTGKKKSRCVLVIPEGKSETNGRKGQGG